MEKYGESYGFSYPIKGFKNEFNINDPKVFCHSESAQAPDCIELVKGNIINGVFLGSGSHKLNSSNFKIYIPRGTKALYYALYGMAPNAQIGAVSQFGTPPTSNGPEKYTDFSYTSGDPYFVNIGGSSLEQLQSGQQFTMNEGGVVQLIKNASVPQVKTGGWIYTKLLFDGYLDVSLVKFRIELDKPVFSTWYTCMNNNNLWDTNGDPNDTKSICNNIGGSTATTDFTSTVSDLAVSFKDASTGSPTAWSWDFGDNSTSTEQNPSHTYAKAGTYTVKLTANSISATKSIALAASTINCASTTCLGNSCWNGTEYIQGTKTDGCATCSITASPQTISTSDISYLTWKANDASAMDVSCTGLVDIKKGAFNYLTDSDWYDANKSWYKKPANAPDGYPMGGADWFSTSGTESCIFYPYNKTDSKEGTPCKVTVAVNKNVSTKTDGQCGTAAKTYSSAATGWGTNDTFCAQGTANPTNPTFPTKDKPTTWTCQGINGGADAGCVATKTTTLSCNGNCGDGSMSDFCSASAKTNSQKITNMSSANKCCEDETCYACDSNYFWNAKTEQCEKIDTSSCYFFAYLRASSKSGTSPMVVKLTNNVVSAFGPFQYSDYSCGTGGTVSGEDNGNFTCAYDSAGTYYPSVKVQGSSCSKTAGAKVVVGKAKETTTNPSYTCQPDDPYCAARTCKNLVCFDGCKRQQGTKDCSGQ